MRQCPTPEGGPGSARPLIAHRISVCDCAKRQQEHYHKCHGCVFRGAPADRAAPESNGTHRNGYVVLERPVVRSEEKGGPLHRNGLTRPKTPEVPAR